jgi:hypothetical protein
MGQGDHNFDLPDGETLAPTPERVAPMLSIMPPGPFRYMICLDGPGAGASAAVG